MNHNIKFEETLILIDSVYLNKVVSELRNHFSKVLNRSLPKADLPTLLECICLDSGLCAHKQTIQTIFIYDENNKSMDAVNPSALQSCLMSTSFKSILGEFLVNSFESTDMATRDELFSESLKLVLDSKDIKNLIVIPSEHDYKDELLTILKEKTTIENIRIFGMIPLEESKTYKWDMLGFSILKSLGVKSDEL